MRCPNPVTLVNLLFLKLPFFIFAKGAVVAGEHLRSLFIFFELPLQPCSGDFSELAAVGLAISPSVAYISVAGEYSRNFFNLCEVV